MALWLNEYLDEFPGKQDLLRYVLTAAGNLTDYDRITIKEFVNQLVVVLLHAEGMSLPGWLKHQLN